MFEIKEYKEGIDGSMKIMKWLEDRFDRSLLILGDATGPLCILARFFVALNPVDKSLRAVLVRFDGFQTPIVSIVSDDSSATLHLLRKVRNQQRIILAIEKTQPLPDDCRYTILDEDAWLVSPCIQEEDSFENVKLLYEASELEDFFEKHNIEFWNPEMLKFGATYGIRNEKGQLVSAAGVNFILQKQRYAQIGPLITDPDYRGRSYATLLIKKVRSHLAGIKINYCGLFADSHNPKLQHLYQSLGFSKRSKFKFIKLHSTQ